MTTGILTKLMPAMYQCQHVCMLMCLTATVIHMYRHVCMSTHLMPVHVGTPVTGRESLCAPHKRLLCEAHMHASLHMLVYVHARTGLTRFTYVLVYMHAEAVIQPQPLGQ